MNSMRFSAVRATPMLLSGLMLWVAGIGGAAAQETNDITLVLGSTTGRPGGTIEVTLGLEQVGDLPESMIVFLAYDPEVLAPVEDYYEQVLRNPLNGELILDNEGNTQTTFSAVQSSEILRGAGKQIDSETYQEEGVIGISVQGLNRNLITPGHLLTIGFAISASASEGVTTEILGVVEGAEVLLPDGEGGVTAVATSVSRGVTGSEEVEHLNYDFENVEVAIGCVAPDAPGNLTATQNRPDMVFLTWNAVAGTGIEYRVYRSQTNNPSSAAPIGEGWQTAVTFEDITARVPEQVPGEGCVPQATVEPVRYFYWVAARSQEGCESDLSAPPVVGFRISGSKFAAAGPVLFGLVATGLLARRRRR